MESVLFVILKYLKEIISKPSVNKKFIKMKKKFIFHIDHNVQLQNQNSLF